MDIVTKSAYETQKIARAIVRGLTVRVRTGARVYALEGDLGAGKTTFTQGFARALGIRERVVSPTFVLMKIYLLAQKPKEPKVQGHRFKHLIHIDCYRLDSPKDLLHLGFTGFLKDKDAIILIEWAHRIRKIHPKDTCWIAFKHKAKNQRVISII